MRMIPLTQGQVSLVDDKDYEVLARFNWYANRTRTKFQDVFYVVHNTPRSSGKRKLELMHRVVLARKLGRPIADGKMCDHIDGNTLNNQRANLREVTSRMNASLRHDPRSSIYIGVSLDGRDRKWETRIQVSKGKRICLGRHATELAAAMAREAYVTAHPELGAQLNFPNGEAL